MKKIICSTFLVFIVLFLSAQSPYKQHIVDLATITFPQKPARIDTLGQIIFQFADSTAIYSVIGREITQGFMPLGKDELPNFYKGTIAGFVRASKGKLIHKKSFEIAGLKGVDIELVTTANPALPDLRYARFILLNNTMITVSFMTLSENKLVTQNVKTQFLNSLNITADTTTLTQGVEHPSAHLIGFILGKLAAWAVIFGVIAGFIFLIRRITIKKKKSIDKQNFRN